MIVPRNTAITIFAVSVGCILTSFLVMVVFPFIYKAKVAEKTNLVNGTFLFPLWRDLPLPIYKRMYFFNITNAEDFMMNGTTMQVEEVGPYTYAGRWTKEDLRWLPEGKISYREKKTFHFVPEKSVGSESDEIYTLNGPYIIASDVLNDKWHAARIAANQVFNFLGENLIITKTIGELTFGGFKDPIMRFGKYYRWDSPYRSGTFAWLHKRNATDEGEFEVFTGETDHDLLNIIDRWNGYNDLEFWNDKYCNMINGTNAEFSPPLRADQTEYTFFQPLICRSVTFRYSGSEDHKGIQTRRFENGADIFSKENPDNNCFEIDPELKSGVLDVSPCQYGAPVVLSFPHFYMADSSFVENVHGLEPDKRKHGSHIDVEPVSGVTVDLSIKIQMNLKVKPVKHLSAFKKASPGVYPVFWLELLVELPDELINTIDYQVFRPSRIVYTTVKLVVVVSMFFIVLVIVQTERPDSEETKPLLKEEASKDSLTKKCDERNYGELKPVLCPSTQEPSQELFDSFKYLEKSMSYSSPITSLGGIYESYSAEESDEDKHVEVHRTTLFKKRSFKEARVLTVV